MKPFSVKRALICLTGIVLLFLAVTVGATLIFSASVSPESVYEGTITTFNLTVNNNLGGDESICGINISMSNFSITGTGSFENWSVSNGTNWLYMNTTSRGITTNTITTFENIVRAKANSVVSDINDTWNVTAYSCSSNNTNSTTFNVTILNDILPPIAGLVSPSNNNFTNINTSLNFSCNATDAQSGLANIILWGNFSGNWLANSTNLVSGGSNETNFTITGPLFDSTYLWSCEACDQAGNCNFSAENRTITIDTVAPSIVEYWFTVQGESPTTNNTVYISPNAGPGIKDGVMINITANEDVKWNITISNSTWNKTYWWTNTYTQNIIRPSDCTYWNGTYNSCSGTYLAEDYYVVNVMYEDQAGNPGTPNTSKTIIIDNTVPTVNLIAPANNTWSNSSNNNFIFNFIDNLSPTANCSLLINGSLQTSNNSVLNGTNTTFSVTMTDGVAQNWSIICTDLAANSQQSVNRKINVDTVLPQVEFIPPTPANGISQTAKNFVANVSHNESNPAQLWILLNGIINISQPYSGNYTNLTIGSLTDGNYNYQICLNDSAGNQNCTETRTITIYTQSGTGGSYSGPSYFYICQENWSCSEWSDCINGTQTRTCQDLNNCGTEDYRPSTTTSCVVPGPEAGQTQICTPGQKRCESGNVQVCSSDGMAWELAEICGQGCENGTCLVGQEVSLTGLIIGKEVLLTGILGGLIVLIAAGSYHLWRKRPFRYRYPV